MAAGHLFPSIGHPASSFTPWLGVIHGGHYVLKYVPVVSAFLAVSLVLTGGYVAALAGWAAGLVFATYLLAKHVTGQRNAAALAAVLMAVSPVVMVQSALALPYVPFLVLAELAIWGAFSGCRRRDRRVLAIAGLCGALALVARPYDAILIFAPTLGWALWSTPTGRLRCLGGLAAGALPPCVGLLWFDQAATGSPFRLPFSLFSNADTLGFGIHRMYPGEAARRFGIGQAWDGMARHLSLLTGGWAAGGLILVGLAAFALLRRKASSAALSLLAGGVLLTIGYLFFWGIWNAAILWGAVRYLGPYYLLPLLIPLTILAAQGALALVERGVWPVAGVAAIGAFLSGAALFASITTNSALNADNVQLATSVAKLGRSLVFVDTYPNYLQHPTSVISDASPPDGRTVYALDSGAANFAVRASYPGRPIYRLQLLGEYGKHAHRGYGAALDRVELLQGPAVTLVVSSLLPNGVRGARLLVTVGDAHCSWSLNQGQPLRITLKAGRSGAGARSAQTIWGVRPGKDGAISFTLTATVRGGIHTLSRVRIPLLLTTHGRLQALAPVRRTALLGPLSPPMSVDGTHPVLP
jgi:4-amino-4-deoxy-L-arabinose transferase-like glycosyltransferase